jgi:hypothetical protein
MATIKIKYDGMEKVVDFDEFVVQSGRMLDEFGLRASNDEIRKQVRAVIAGGKLNVIGVFLSDYIVK